jgi:hypothetical protein
VPELDESPLDQRTWKGFEAPYVVHREVQGQPRLGRLLERGGLVGMVGAAQPATEVIVKIATLTTFTVAPN